MVRENVCFSVTKGILLNHHLVTSFSTDSDFEVEDHEFIEFLMNSTVNGTTLPEINVAPENQWLED